MPEHHRGTYLGLASEPVIDHLKRLGVTTIELLPVHHAVDERRLVDLGLSNYWAYSPLAYSSPFARYATASQGEQVDEFKSMVKTFHAAGIEVMLDVVYNHTAEVDRLGPTLSLRGLDNSAYYRLLPDNPREYEDCTGCGNSLNLHHPRTLQLVMDSLRYWVEEMHVDGFRFDLATVLGRGRGGFDREGAFFAAVQQDPVLADIKLIAEPWDIGSVGYRVGEFPIGWSEWNDKYRSSVRAFWRGEQVSLGELSTRLSGSSDLYQVSGRGPTASVNFVTCHDGFTLEDLVSYDQKHNEANGEDNRDGSDHNLSRNWGVEGATDDPTILDLRDGVKRSFMATLAFSLGVPMISAGDEFGRTQKGNNNAYCQDSEIAWVDWNLTDRQRELLAATCELFTFRRRTRVFRHAEYLSGESRCACGLKDVAWLSGDGEEIPSEQWHDAQHRMLGMLLHRCDVAKPGGRNDQDHETALVIYNGNGKPHQFSLPDVSPSGRWNWVIQTARLGAPRRRVTGKSVRIAARSVALLVYKGTT